MSSQAQAFNKASYTDKYSSCAQVLALQVDGKALLWALR